MKLYIDSYHYNPNRLKIHLLKNKFKHDKCTTVEFYTNNGIYITENNELYKLVPMDNPIELVTIHELDFIIDKSSSIMSSMCLDNLMISSVKILLSFSCSVIIALLDENTNDSK